MNKILLVDDNVFIRKLLGAVLEKAGYEVHPCENAYEGIEALARDSYALVVTDIVLPEKSGIEFMEHIKREKIRVPILAITGGVENAVNDYVSYASMFADATLAKPVNHDEFVEVAGRLIAAHAKKTQRAR